MYLLGFLHRDASHQAQPPTPNNLDDPCKSCYIHDHFQLQLEQTRKCRCGRVFPDENQLSVNNFSFIVPAQGADGMLGLIDADLKQQPARSSSLGRFTSYNPQSQLSKVLGRFPNYIRQVYVRD